ncbi:MAG: hypothetical protein V9E94_15470 [Microthrixaceae bacterium]
MRNTVFCNGSTVFHVFDSHVNASLPPSARRTTAEPPGINSSRVTGTLPHDAIQPGGNPSVASTTDDPADSNELYVNETAAPPPSVATGRWDHVNMALPVAAFTFNGPTSTYGDGPDVPRRRSKRNENTGDGVMFDPI